MYQITVTCDDHSPLAVVLCVGGRGQGGVWRRGRGVAAPGVRVGVGDHHAMSGPGVTTHDGEDSVLCVLVFTQLWPHSAGQASSRLTVNRDIAPAHVSCVVTSVMMCC